MLKAGAGKVLCLHDRAADRSVQRAVDRRHRVIFNGRIHIEGENMKKRLLIFLLILPLCLSFGCQKAPDNIEPIIDVTADVEAVRNLESEYEAAMNTGDIEKFMSLYADDAVSISANMPATVGKGAIREMFQWFFDNATTSGKSEIQDVLVSGDLAVSRGIWKADYTAKESGISSSGLGSWIMVYRKQPDGSWKILWEIGSDETLINPPPAEEEKDK